MENEKLLSAISDMMDQKFEPIHQRLDRMEGRMDHMEDCMGHMEDRMDRMEGRMDKLNGLTANGKPCNYSALSFSNHHIGSLHRYNPSFS